MSDWFALVGTEELPPGTCRPFIVEDMELLLCNDAGEYFALENLCSHDQAPIGEGRLIEGKIVCPRHGAKFCVRTGEALSPPAYEPIAIFPVKVVDETVYIRDDRWD